MNDTGRPVTEAEANAPEDAEKKLIIEADRRFLDSLSFRTAAEFAGALCSPLPFMPPPEHEDTIKKALSMAAVVSYGRPFTVQHHRFEESESKKSEHEFHFRNLYTEHLKSIEDSDRELHFRLLEYRHKFVAHSAAAAAQIKFLDDPRAAYSRQVPTLSEAQVQDLKRLATIMGSLATGRYGELRRLLAESPSFEQ